MKFLSLLLTAALACPASAFARAEVKPLGRVKTVSTRSTLVIPQLPRVVIPQIKVLSPEAARIPVSAFDRLKILSAAIAPPAAAVRAQAKSDAKAISAASKTMDGSGEFAEAAEPVVDASAGAAGQASARAPPAPQAAERPQRRLEDIKQLKVGTYNVLNLFEMVGKWIPDPNHAGKRIKVSQQVPKPDDQLRGSAKAILEMDLDIISLQEVENVKALQQFSDKYLGGTYQPLLIEGNDERGIDVGFLIKKDIPVQIEHRTHKGETWSDPNQGGRQVPLFSRDLPSLVVRAPGRAQPLFVMFGTHFKSKRDRAGDRESRKLRRAQVERAAEIVLRYRKEFGDKVPIMLAGDFNGELNREPEFEALRRAAGLIDGLDLAKPPLTPQQRITHTYHPNNGPADKKQMDAVMVSDSMKGLVTSALVYRYKDDQGREIKIPDTYEERSRNPSDHFPVMIVLDFQPLLKP